MQPTERLISFREYKTWVQVTEPDQPNRNALPVVFLHGGPGMSHDYLKNFAALAEDGRTVVHYDQIGGGRSTHIPNAPSSYWTPALFVEEFLAVINGLGFGRYHVVGHSWGGMLAAEIAATRPVGLASIALLSSPASMELWMRGTASLRRRLPAEVQKILDRHEADGTTDSAEYEAAVQVFYDNFLCRIQPPPSDLAATFEQFEADPTVYLTMNGPNEFFVTGSLRDWSIVDRLPDIEVPALVLAGEYDEATPSAWAPYAENIPEVRVHLEPDTSHINNLEHPAEVLAVVGAHLRRHDGHHNS